MMAAQQPDAHLVSLLLQAEPLLEKTNEVYIYIYHISAVFNFLGLDLALGGRTGRRAGADRG